MTGYAATDTAKNTSHPDVETFLRALATGTTADRRDAWRAVMDAGSDTVPTIREKLASPAWSNPPRGPSPQYLAGLLALLAELDRVRFDAEVADLKARPLHPMHRHVVDFIGGATDAKPQTTTCSGIPIFVAADVPRPARIGRLIAGWAKNPLVDLSGVSRIDVITRASDADYTGKYDILRSTVIVNWPAASSPLNVFVRLQVEWTFLHEVGHHVSGHLEGGQVAPQEAEADAFASRAFRQAHPGLSAIVRALLMPVTALLRLRVRRRP